MQSSMNRSRTVQAVLKQLRRDIVMRNLANDTPVTRELFALNFCRTTEIKDTLQERHLLIAKMLLDKDEMVIDILKNYIAEAQQLSVAR